jgi:hypothetical protein
VSDMSGAEAQARAARAYLEVFADIADGRNRTAALILRDLDADQLAELHVICGDVQVMVEGEQRRRGGQAEGFAAACARADADPRERQRLRDIADLAEAEDIIYHQAIAATGRGDRDSALTLLRWCARTEIGESAWLLAVALEEAGDLAEALTWYARAADGGDGRAADRLARGEGSGESEQS